MKQLIFILFLYIFFSLNYNVFATTGSGLAYSKEWLRFLYYERTIFGGYNSTVKNSKFFLHESGMNNPKQEFNKNLNLVKEISEKIITREKLKNTDIQYLCSFPARIKYLSKIIEVDNKKLECPDFLTWKNSFEAQGISIIFASQFLGNPASAMGHTYIRVISKSRSLYLNKIVSFAATIPDDVGIFRYIWNGLFGGFIGKFSVNSFYIKFHEYTNIEQRDLWEYELQFSKEQLDTFFRHLWELEKMAEFDYFFISKNCSYMLLELLDSTNPNWRTAELTSSYVLPIKTLQILRDLKLVTRRRFYPSISSTLIDKLSRLSTNQYNDYLQAVKTKELKPRNDILVLDSLIDFYSYKRHKNQGILPKQDKSGLKKILVARSKILSNNNDTPLQNTYYPPDEASTPMRFSIAQGYHNNIKEYNSFEFRPFLHDLRDRVHGHLKFSEINFLKTRFLRSYKRKKIYFQDIQVFGIKNNEYLSLIKKDPAWGVDLYFKRKILNNDDAGKYYVETAPFFGVSWRLGGNHQVGIKNKYQVKYGNLGEVNLNLIPQFNFEYFYEHNGTLIFKSSITFGLSIKGKKSDELLLRQENKLFWHLKTNWAIGFESELYKLKSDRVWQVDLKSLIIYYHNLF